MVTMSIDPNDVDLAYLLAPQDCSPSVAIDDTPERLVARPLGYPLPWVIFFILVPLVTMTVYAVLQATRQRVDPEMIGFLAFGWLGPASFLIALFYAINRGIVSKGDFFVLDKVGRTLALPPRGLLFR